MQQRLTINPQGPYNVFNKGYLIALLFIIMPLCLFFSFNFNKQVAKFLFALLFASLLFKLALLICGFVISFKRLQRSRKAKLYAPYNQNADLYIENLKKRYGDIPSFTILLPLFKESPKVMCQLVRSLRQLKYDKTKVEFLLLTEEYDLLTKRCALKILHFVKDINLKLIEVPHSLPKTKPKACNYGLSFAKGDIIGIYDAEDIPSAIQLIKVAEVFLMDAASCTDKVQPCGKIAAVQCPLLFYNKNRNFLTRCFFLEYLMWFNFILPALSRFNMPISLGGTSNFIKKDVLLSGGGWSGFNVTEDAELGLRLFFSGYKIAFADCQTKEECPFEIRNWMNQRIRWIKGFNQTYFFYFFKSFSLLKHKSLVGLKSPRPLIDFVFFHLIYGFSAVGFLFLFCYLVTTPFSGLGRISFIYSFSGSMALGMIFGFVNFIGYIVWKQSVKKSLTIISLHCFALFFYFFLHQVAAIAAIVELITNPCKWHKTKHYGQFIPFSMQK
jgi:glycosyltransferase XagB